MAGTRRRRGPQGRWSLLPDAVRFFLLLLLVLLLGLARPAGAEDDAPAYNEAEDDEFKIEAVELRGGVFRCAWQFETDWKLCNMGVIDQTARYVGWPIFVNHRVYKMRGRYPTDGRYYALTVYDTSGVNILGSMADFQIKPVPGTGGNPYRDAGVEGPGQVGEYEIHIVTDGRSRGLENEIVLDLWNNMTAIPIAILREYGLADPSKPCQTVPQVSFLNRDEKGWTPVPTCPEDMRIRVGNKRCRQITSVNPFNPNEFDNRVTRRMGCQLGQLSPKDNIWNNFALKAEGGIDNILGMPPVFTNAFSEYMYWCVSQHYLNMTGGVFLKIKGTLPKICTGVFEGPSRAADLGSYDIRYLSLTLADLWWPGNVFKTITGLDIEKFYKARHGAGWDRTYSIVVAYDESFARRAGMYDDQNEMLMLWKERKHPEGAVNPIIVFREILPSAVQREMGYRPFHNYAVAEEISNLAFGTMVRAHKQCVKSPRSELCHAPEYLSKELEPGYYPSIEIWRSDCTTGAATRIK